MKEGDNNTRFFHRIANSHRRTNHIRGIEVDGVLYEDEEEVRSKVVQFYQNLYTVSDTWHPSTDGLEFSRIEEDERLSLERDFPKEEVVKVLQEMEGDKAPGPNSHYGIFSKMLECSGKRCYGLFYHFHRSSEFEWPLNASFLSLIPKKNNALNIKDFRPINLVGNVYKLLSKVLANRLRLVLDKLISES